MHMFTAAFRTVDLVLFVFRKGEDGFEWLLAIFAEKFVRGMSPPNRTQQPHSTAPEAPQSGRKNNTAPKGWVVTSLQSQAAEA